MTSTTCFFLLHLISIEGSKAQNLAMSRFFTMLKISRGILPIWLVQLLFQCLMKMSCSATGNVLRITWISSWQAMSLTTWDARAGQRQFCSEKHRNHQMLNSLGAWVLSPNEVFKKTFISRKDHTISKSWVLQTGASFSYVLSKHQDRDASGTVLWSLQRGWCMAQLCHVWFWLGACFTCKDPTMFKPLDIKTSPGGSYCHHGTGGLGVIPAIHLGLVVLNGTEESSSLVARCMPLPSGCWVSLATTAWLLLHPSLPWLVSVCSDGRSQVSSLECVSCSHWSPNILDSKGSQKDLFTFSNLKTKCIPKCPLLRCTPTQVYEDTGRWKSWVSMGKHGIQHGIIGFFQRKTREEHSGKWVFTSGLSWKLWGVFLVLATPPKFCLQPCEVQLNTLQGSVITLDVVMTATIGELKSMLLEKHPFQSNERLWSPERRGGIPLSSAAFMLKLLSCHSWRQICPIELTLLSSMFFAGKTLIAC